MSTLERFSGAERLLHWGNALAVLWLGATGALVWAHLDRVKLLGLNAISQAHSVLGGGLLLGGLLYFALRRKRAIAHAGLRFNPGQRLNLAVMPGVLGLQALLGVVMYFGRSLGLDKPTRHLLSEVHLAIALAIGVLVLGHLWMVFGVPKHRGILQAMWTGRVNADVARRSSPGWTAAVTSNEAS